MTLHTAKLVWAGGGGYTPCSPAYLEAARALDAFLGSATPALRRGPAAAHADARLGLSEAWWAAHDALKAECAELLDAGHVGRPVRLVVDNARRST